MEVVSFLEVSAACIVWIAGEGEVVATREEI